MPRANDRHDLPSQHPWPRLHWRPELWFTFVGSLLAFVVFFWPSISDSQSPVSSRLLIGIPLLLAPLLAPALLWLLATTRTVARRVRDYPRVHLAAVQELDDIDSLKSDVYAIALQRQEARALNILAATVVDGHLYLSLARTPDTLLAIDDPVAVIDQSDGLTMGMFKITQVREQDYYAVGTSGINPLWKGQVLQLGETTMFPNMVALAFREGDAQ